MQRLINLSTYQLIFRIIQNDFACQQEQLFVISECRKGQQQVKKGFLSDTQQHYYKINT